MCVAQIFSEYMKVKQLEADYQLSNILYWLGILKIIDRLIGYSVKVHSTSYTEYTPQHHLPILQHDGGGHTLQIIL